MAWLKLLLTFLPSVLQVVIAIEQALVGVPGPVKKQVAMSILNPPTQADPTLGGLIDTVVQSLNGAGVFPPKADNTTQSTVTSTTTTVTPINPIHV
jgi:hypothetical protein